MEISRRVFATVLVAAACSTSYAHVTAAGDVLHQAIWSLVNGQLDHTVDIVRGAVDPPGAQPALARRQNAALLNLGARAYYERYEREKVILALPAAKSAKYLEAAETFAAAAVWERPYDLTYWQDYVRFASEERRLHAQWRSLTAEQAVEEVRKELLLRKLSYPDLGGGFEITSAEELRHVGDAVVHGIQGDLQGAEEILTSWISEPTGRTRCTSAVILLEMRLDADRFEQASEHIDELVPLCAGSEREWLLTRRELLRGNAKTREDLPLSKQRAQAGWTLQGAETTVTPTPEAPLAIANRILRDPSRNEDWDQLQITAGADKRILKLYDQLVARCFERYDGRPPRAVYRARAFRFIQRGKFERAHLALEKLLENRTGTSSDAEIQIAAILIDTDERMDSTARSEMRLREAQIADPHLAACIDERALEPCLKRRDECRLCSVLCNDASDDLVYRVWTRGWRLRPTAALQVAECLDELRRRVELDEYLTTQFESRIEDQLQVAREDMERRFAATEERVHVIVETQLPAMERKLKDLGLKEGQLAERLKKEELQRRREVSALLQRESSDMMVVTALAREAKITSTEAMRLLNAHAGNLALLEALTPRLSELLGGQWERMRSEIVQLSAAVQKLEEPELVRHVRVLQHLESASAEEILNSLTYVLNDLATLALPTTGPAKLLKLLPIVKGLSDFLLDAYHQRMRQE